MITRGDVGKFSHASLARARAILAGTGPMLCTVGRLARGEASRVCQARRFWLFIVEVIGVVLVTFGISFWSIPAAIIIGGLVLVVTIEVRPGPTPKLPEIPIPDGIIKKRAEVAAQYVNFKMYGIDLVDPGWLEKLSDEECQRIILLARSLGLK